MNTHIVTLCGASACLLACATTASAAITITQQSAAAPTYSNALTFDEPGTPTGLVGHDYWQSSHGFTVTDGVNPNATVVNDFTGSQPWIGTGNSMEGNFGIFMTFDNDVSAMSFQAWDPSGEPDFFGNGLTVVVTDAADNTLAFEQFTGAWGGVGDTWINITTTDGDSFAKASIFNNSFAPLTYIDNFSFNNVPTPGALALLGLAGVTSRRRRSR